MLLIRWIDAREVEWFSENQIDNCIVYHIFKQILLTDCAQLSQKIMQKLNSFVRGTAIDGADNLRILSIM